jgi:molybdenum cofactor biosynthesis enzyme MoaA
MGRYSQILGKIGPTCNPNNPCSGKYGKCLDLKLTNECNGNCPFCIEAKGYSPNETKDTKELSKKINDQNIKDLLILGGEPLLYPDIVGLVSQIRSDINIYLTTNGSLLIPELAKRLSPFLKGINISIHHSTSAKHKELTKIALDGNVLYKSIQTLGPDKVRINCNLVKGYIDSQKEINAVYDLVTRLKVKKIRFAELQNCPALFVDAGTIFDNVPSKPFEEGCEINIPKKGLEVTLRLTCGLVDRNKKAVDNPVGRNIRTQVMYSDGQIQDEWLGSGTGCY